MRILVVEDERITAMSIKLTLEGIGYKDVRLAYSGEEALETAGRFKPDTVLMDIRMPPGMDGIETASKMRAAFDGDVSIIYLSALSDDKTIHRAVKTNPNGYLTKPLNEAMLENILAGKAPKIGYHCTVCKEETVFRQIGSDLVKCEKCNITRSRKQMETRQ